MTAALKLFKWPGQVPHADILSCQQNKYRAILLEKTILFQMEWLPLPRIRSHKHRKNVGLGISLFEKKKNEYIQI